MTITSEVEDSRWAALGDMSDLAERCIASSLSDSTGAGQRDVHVLFASDTEVRLLNQNFRGQDKPTNVLSFPADGRPHPDGSPPPLGEIALAYETICREAAEQGKPVLHHVSHLIVHGLLHLLGYDHDTDTAADAMEARERDILSRLGIPDPYLT